MRASSFLFVMGLGGWACTDSNSPSSTADPQVSADLQVDHPCPEAVYQDGLGGLNPLAAKSGVVPLAACDTVPSEDPFPDSAGIWLGTWDPQVCWEALWDPDADGIHNGCENALAQAFAPELIMTTAECKWDYYLNRLGGEYYFAAQEAEGQYYGRLRIAYLPGYYEDCGTRHDLLSVCTATFPFGWCAGHTGDSEFMLIDISYNFGTYHWVADSIFLSAHCDEITGNECQWYPNLAPFEWRDRPRGAPVVWVSEKKHASYPSQAACNSGVTVGICPLCTEFEFCQFNTVGLVFPIVYTQQNVGSRATPLRDCAAAFSESPETSRSRWECMWTTDLPWGPKFNGWQSQVEGDASTPYSNRLKKYANF